MNLYSGAIHFVALCSVAGRDIIEGLENMISHIRTFTPWNAVALVFLCSRFQGALVQLVSNFPMSAKQQVAEVTLTWTRDVGRPVYQGLL